MAQLGQQHTHYKVCALASFIDGSEWLLNENKCNKCVISCKNHLKHVFTRSTVIGCGSEADDWLCVTYFSGQQCCCSKQLDDY